MKQEKCLLTLVVGLWGETVSCQNRCRVSVELHLGEPHLQRKTVGNYGTTSHST